MKPLLYAVLTSLALTASCAPAGAPPYDLRLTEPDQELDGFTGTFSGIHYLSAQLRGVRGSDSTVYWVSSDSRQLLAYQRGQLIWQANVGAAFARQLPTAYVNRLILCSNTVFVMTTQQGHAEVNRANGPISAVGVDH